MIRMTLWSYTSLTDAAPRDTRLEEGLFFST
jgi:hypothetical protein